MTAARPDWTEIRRRVAASGEAVSMSWAESAEKVDELLDERARSYGARKATRRTGRETKQFLCFEIAAEKLLLPLHAVSGILAFRPLGPVPMARRDLLGTLYERGQIYSVYSIRTMLGHPEGPKPGSSARIVLLSGNNSKAGLVADSVAGIRRFPAQSVADLQSGSGDSRHIRGLLEGHQALLDELALNQYLNDRGGA